MPTATDNPSLYLRRFSDLLRRSEGEPAWLRRRRETAMERFLALGVPTVKNEEYKYTDLAALADGELLLSTSPGPSPAKTDGLRSMLRFEDGAIQLADLEELPAGVRVRRLSDALRQEASLLEERLAAIANFETHALCALNTAFFEDGALVEVAPGAIIEQPIQVAFGAGSGPSHPRVLILAGRGSSVRVVEHYAGSGSYWRNAVTEVHAAANARVDHYRVQLESLDAYHTGLFQAVQERDSSVSTFSLSFGAARARNDIGTRLDGSGCECALDGLYAARGSQLVDHHTAIDHAKPHCNSHQLYKGILDGHAKGVFNGKIFVRRDAQKTDAVQSNKNLLLSDEAEANTKPQLEIDANDVRCTHGATIGQLDATAAFYLRSRGIDAAQARNILTYAFAADALARIRIEPLKERFEALLLETFAPGRR